MSLCPCSPWVYASTFYICRLSWTGTQILTQVVTGEKADWVAAPHRPSPIFKNKLPRFANPGFEDKSLSRPGGWSGKAGYVCVCPCIPPPLSFLCFFRSVSDPVLLARYTDTRRSWLACVCTCVCFFANQPHRFVRVQLNQHGSSRSVWR